MSPSLGRRAVEFYITPWGFLKGAAANNATASRRRVDGKNYTVLTWSPTVKAPSGKKYAINGYVNEQNFVERVETWVGDNIMGDMHILAIYSGWKDFGGVMAPSKIVQTRGGWPFFEVDVTVAKPNPPDVATLASLHLPAVAVGVAARLLVVHLRGGGGAVLLARCSGWRRSGWRSCCSTCGWSGRTRRSGGRCCSAGSRRRSRSCGGGGGRGGQAPALTVTNEKLGDGVYRLTTGAGSYDSLIMNFKDYIMMLEAGQK